MSFLELCGIIFIGILIINIIVGIWAIKTSGSVKETNFEIFVDQEKQDAPVEK